MVKLKMYWVKVLENYPNHFPRFFIIFLNKKKKIYHKHSSPLLKFSPKVSEKSPSFLLLTPKQTLRVFHKQIPLENGSRSVGYNVLHVINYFLKCVLN
jgi:hypothetical protein